MVLTRWLNVDAIRQIKIFPRLKKSSMYRTKNICDERKHNVEIMLENLNAPGKKNRLVVGMTTWNDMANTNGTNLIMLHPIIDELNSQSQNQQPQDLHCINEIISPGGATHM